VGEHRRAGDERKPRRSSDTREGGDGRRARTRAWAGGGGPEPTAGSRGRDHIDLRVYLHADALNAAPHALLGTRSPHSLRRRSGSSSRHRAKELSQAWASSISRSLGIRHPGE